MLFSQDTLEKNNQKVRAGGDKMTLQMNRNWMERTC